MPLCTAESVGVAGPAMTSRFSFRCMTSQDQISSDTAAVKLTRRHVNEPREERPEIAIARARPA